MSKDNKNSMLEIKAFLNDPDKPLSTAEFAEFWGSLTEEEKDEYRNMSLE